MVTTADIFNRPPAISEDTLQYVLYPSDTSDKASVTSLATVLQDYVDTLLPDFLWHRDPFELKVVTDPESGGWLLEGRMRVGDSVDDEWCVVWLLREISKKWDVVISVFDSDGEFLLIEAAEALPSWVTPTNAENRVWIYASHLHLIPLSHVSPPSSKRHRRDYPRVRDEDHEEPDAEEEEWLNPSDAVSLVRDPAVNTTTSKEVEDTVWKRISGYPIAARQHVHTTNAWLPLDIAKALSTSPALVQKPIETFYTRDAIQLRAAQRMSRFPPSPSVLRPLRMTRTAYAQLVGQKFHPPKVFGRWEEREGMREWRWRDVGMKIACGFEMLYQESKGKAEGTRSVEMLNASAQARKEALRRNPEYVKYIQSLVSAGYFKGEQEGSWLWNELESKAANAFVDARREDDASRESFASMVSSAISQAPESTTQSGPGEEDSDGWLDVDAKDLEDILEKAEKGREDVMDVDRGEEGEEEAEAARQAKRLEELAMKVGEFVEGEGDLGGARFADEASSDEGGDEGEDEDEELSDERFEDSDEESDEGSEGARAARQAAMDALVPGIDPSEYGRMPATYHSNSQRVAKSVGEADVPASVPSGELRRPMRAPLLPRDRYEGASDSDDESPSEAEDEEDEEDRPQLVGEVEIDMEQEEEEFIEFSRRALGISDEQWAGILRERKERGAFVPASARGGEERKAASAGVGAGLGAPMPAKEARAGQKPASQAATGKPGANPDLDSFEAVMQAMDAELAAMKAQSAPGAKGKETLGKGKAKATEEADMDIEEAMDAELRAALEGEDEEGEEGEASVDYNLIKNFLESFKSQAGAAGPVGNLAGRLQQGWAMPRDER
ncbi:SGT1-domain-containing protein [Heliocybe sulcata]|uniref:SGT1-domain-containing protein n=1 Tax=Heliocybe sulcata TaxID=5364 RepID=A0A5C3NIF7_9AGAM|nr:SGT1-domain-containing protein [Heliocybe sulcata]